MPLSHESGVFSRLGYNTLEPEGAMSGKAPRQKGDRFEREVVHQAQDAGWIARRMPLSGAVDGFGNDVIIGEQSFECKVKRGGWKSVEAILEGAEQKGGKGAIFKRDRGEPYLIIRLDSFLRCYEEREEEPMRGRMME